MKKLVILCLLLATAANAEIKSLDDILEKATAEEKNDLVKILQQIRIVSAKDPKTGKSVFKVVAVEKGSVFDRGGVKVGDFLYSKSQSSSGTTMELKDSLQSNAKGEATSQ